MAWMINQKLIFSNIGYNFTWVDFIGNEDINENGVDLAMNDRHNEMVKGKVNDFYDSGY